MKAAISGSILSCANSPEKEKKRPQAKTPQHLNLTGTPNTSSEYYMLHGLKGAEVEGRVFGGGTNFINFYAII